MSCIFCKIVIISCTHFKSTCFYLLQHVWKVQKAVIVSCVYTASMEMAATGVMMMADVNMDVLVDGLVLNVTVSISTGEESGVMMMANAKIAVLMGGFVIIMTVSISKGRESGVMMMMMIMMMMMMTMTMTMRRRRRRRNNVNVDVLVNGVMINVTGSISMGKEPCVTMMSLGICWQMDW